MRPARKIIRGHTVPPRDPRGRREGYTTGTSAAAAAQAACLVLFDLGWPETVPIHLPIGRTLDIRINTLEYDSEVARTGVVKDAGDDPDVTHGAEIFAAVRQVPEPGIHIKGGVGVGVVTKPGLGMPVGSPSINPVPQRMIREAISAALRIANVPLRVADCGLRIEDQEPNRLPASSGDSANPQSGIRNPQSGIEVTISVPNGEEIAKKTFNARLGIMGGISILGTTGIVKAMSTAAWRASVLLAIDVAAANSVGHIVLSTGGRTERFAQQRYPQLPEMAFVEMGIFTGACLKRAAERGVPRITLACMIGKLSKIAAGKMQTHVAGNQVDFAFLSQLAAELKAPAELVEQIARANSARHVQELVDAASFPGFYPRLAELARQQCAAQVQGAMQMEVMLFDFEGKVMAVADDR